MQGNNLWRTNIRTTCNAVHKNRQIDGTHRCRRRRKQIVHFERHKNRSATTRQRQYTYIAFCCHLLFHRFDFVRRGVARCTIFHAATCAHSRVEENARPALCHGGQCTLDARDHCEWSDLDEQPVHVPFSHTPLHAVQKMRNQMVARNCRSVGAPHTHTPAAARSHVANRNTMLSTIFGHLHVGTGPPNTQINSQIRKVYSFRWPVLNALIAA